LCSLGKGMMGLTRFGADGNSSAFRQDARHISLHSKVVKSKIGILSGKLGPGRRWSSSLRPRQRAPAVMAPLTCRRGYRYERAVRVRPAILQQSPVAGDLGEFV
jgi:hypothetical protein